MLILRLVNLEKAFFLIFHKNHEKYIYINKDTLNLSEAQQVGKKAW